MKKKSIININHKNHNVAFFFQALFSAIILAVAFLIDDVIDNAIDSEIHESNKKYIKLGAHVVVIFLLSFILIYAFRWIFGWGDTFLG